MSEHIDRLSAEIESLTELKQPGKTGSAQDIKLSEEHAEDFDQEVLSTISIPTADQAEPGKETTASDENLTSFDASSYVEQGVVIADKLLQKLFDWMDKNTSMHREDRWALDHLLWKEKNGLVNSPLSEYEKWLLSQGHKLAKNSDDRVMTDAERDNFVKALRAMPWIKDRLMTPQSQLTWALVMYLGVRMVPIGFNMLSGKEQPPIEDIEPEAHKEQPPAPITEKPIPVTSSQNIDTPVTFELPKAD